MPFRRLGYTVVQHQLFVRGGDVRFARGLQSTRLRDGLEVAMVERIGGRVFARYQDAETWAQRQQYPADYAGLLPIAQGTFALQAVGGLPVYIPPVDLD